MTHIFVSKETTIGSDNGLAPSRHQVIIWTNAGILLIRTLKTNFSEILSEIYIFSFKGIHLKMSSAKWHIFFLGLNVLIMFATEDEVIIFLDGCSCIVGPKPSCTPMLIYYHCQQHSNFDRMNRFTFNINPMIVWAIHQPVEWNISCCPLRNLNRDHTMWRYPWDSVIDGGRMTSTGAKLIESTWHRSVKAET